ncbi:beta-propeller domain-containing protein [Paenibacillus ginsengihumi]|uniref:beta-propeller domain-containing protein n=1 Tax=Paenibacillus ginsengihumi TaxID=431596 RepID=UPI00059485F5|nr:beta-propeller domain-containing protein [Paenibacillus ginsengihumi]
MPIVTGVLALALVTSGAPAGLPYEAQAAQESHSIAVSLNGLPLALSVPPRLAGNTMMVPLRDIGEALGVQIRWQGGSQTAEAAKDGRLIRMTAGSREAVRDGQAVTLDQAPLLEDGKLLVPLRFFSESFAFNVYWDGLNRSVSIHDADTSLPTVGSYERMQELLAEAGKLETGLTAKMKVTDQSAEMAMTDAVAPASGRAANSGSGAADYSGTNVQVEGVDEADVIKTDGKYIYQVSRSTRQIVVAEAVPAESMKVVSTVYFDDRQFNPQEMYVDDTHLIVIGQSHYMDDRVYPLQSRGAAESSAADRAASAGSEAAADPAASVSSPAQPGTPAPAADIKIVPVPEQPAPATRIIAPDIMIWPGPARTTTKAIVFDLTDRSNIKQVREVELEGYYVSSRKVGSSLYLVANKSMPYSIMYSEDAAKPAAQRTDLLPTYRDTLAGDGFETIGYEDIRYFPKAVEPNYLLVGGIDLNNPQRKMQVESYLGSGNNVYASQDNLYVTVSEYEQTAADSAGDSSTAKKSLVAPAYDVNSVIYKFALKDGSVSYAGRGKVPGQVLNQFSMDEHDGYFRIATTKGDMWRSDEHTSKNNMYVLDESLNVVGKIEDIAPGEKIYSVRYAGNRAYMVTFKKVDPLFVIDLSNPQAPGILGKLKIPGYSDYLHPYDEHHLIGFGKDAVEVASEAGGLGRAGDTTAYYQGMKLALFDVSDVANPKELFTEHIGDRGTDSELLYNHKALLFSKERNLLAFPVTVMEVKDKGNKPEDAMKYGEFAFQGAYVYQLDLTNGFQLRGKITHMTDEELLKAGQTWVPYNRNVERALYIGDTLYTASQGLIKANDLNSLKEIGSLKLPEAADR